MVVLLLRSGNYKATKEGLLEVVSLLLKVETTIEVEDSCWTQAQNEKDRWQKFKNKFKFVTINVNFAHNVTIADNEEEAMEAENRKQRHG